MRSCHGKIISIYDENSNFILQQKSYHELQESLIVILSPRGHAVFCSLMKLPQMDYQMITELFFKAIMVDLRDVYTQKRIQEGPHTYDTGVEYKSIYKAHPTKFGYLEKS